MPDLPAPVAARLARARWLDTRLLLGVLLVLVSIVVGARVVSAADDTVAVWSVRRDLAPDTILAANDLEQRRVQLGDQRATYVTVGSHTPVGRSLRKGLAKGELLPLSALASPEQLRVRRVSLGVDTFVAGTLTRGSVVDVYRIPKAQGAAAEPAEPAEPAAGENGGKAAAPEASSQAPPATAGTRARLLLGSVTVDSVDEGGKGLGSAAGRAMVVLLLSEPDVAKFLDAQTGGEIALVQVPFAKEGRK